MRVIRHNKIPQKKKFTLREIYEQRKTVLIKRDMGGLGDIFMHRMIFEDFKLLLPELQIHFACPQQYHDAIRDHPFIDKLLDSKKTEEGNYFLAYNTTYPCQIYENNNAPHIKKHRSDIWAEHCGVTLTKHDMHFRLSEEEKNWAQDKIKEINPEQKPTVLLAPISAMMGKNLTKNQLQPVIDEIKKDFFPFILHTAPLPEFDCLTVHGTNLRQYMALINAVDYVISVDTSVFHCAGGMGKPMVAIFGWADAKIYSKYYSKVELVQRHREDEPEWTCGPCHNFGVCPKVPLNEIRKPCITSITPQMILDKFKKNHK